MYLDIHQVRQEMAGEFIKQPSCPSSERIANQQVKPAERFEAIFKLKKVRELMSFLSHPCKLLILNAFGVTTIRFFSCHLLLSIRFPVTRGDIRFFDLLSP